MDAPLKDAELAELADTVLRVSREVDPHGWRAPDIVPLTGTEALVMRWVDMHPGTSPSATADATALRRSNLSAAVRSLVAKDMVDRRADPRDARLVQLFPTARASDSIGRLHAHWASQLRQGLGDVPPVEVRRVLEVLTRLDDGLRR